LQSQHLVQVDKIVSFDSAPALLFPVFILIIGHRDRVPHDFQVLEVGLAVAQFLVVRLFQLEESFQVVEFLSFLLDLRQFDVILVDEGVCVANLLETFRIRVVKGTSGQEILTEYLHFLSETDQVFLDVSGLLGLQGQNVRFDLEHLLCGLVEQGLGVVDSL